MKNAAWPKSEIDRYLLAALEAKNLAPVADADRRTLIRRAYFDLIGLPPTPEEIEAFVADKRSEGVREGGRPAAGDAAVRRAVGPALARRGPLRRIDEQGAEHSRIRMPGGIATTSMTRSPPTSRYDQFVREQIAGDLLPAKNDAQRNEMLTATGFLAIGPKSLNTRNAEQFRMDVADEQLDVATRGVMGLSVACARCHDHKFDPIPTADYYAMVGIFRSTDVLGGVKRGQQPHGLRRRVRLSDQRRPSEAAPAAEDRKRAGRAENASWKTPRTSCRRSATSARKKHGRGRRPTTPNKARKARPQAEGQARRATRRQAVSKPSSRPSSGSTN